MREHVRCFFPFFLGTFSFAALLAITSHVLRLLFVISGDAREFLSLVNLSLLRAPYMLNPLLIGGISRGLAVALAAPSSRAVRIHLTMHRCAPFILYFASAKYRLTVTPSNEIKDTSFPPPFPSLPLSFSFSWSRGRESRARGSGEVPATWPTTPLRSLRSRTSYRGLFFLREPLPALRELCFSFLSLPRPPSTVPLAVLP